MYSGSWYHKRKLYLPVIHVQIATAKLHAGARAWNEKEKGSATRECHMFFPAIGQVDREDIIGFRISSRGLLQDITMINMYCKFVNLFTSNQCSCFPTPFTRMPKKKQRKLLFTGRVRLQNGRRKVNLGGYQR